VIVHVGKEMPVETETETGVGTEGASESDTDEADGDETGGAPAAGGGDDGGCSITGRDQSPLAMLGLLTLLAWPLVRRRE
jgi:uncharacterized protein (TIGR03382 family)